MKPLHHLISYRIEALSHTAMHQSNNSVSKKISRLADTVIWENTLVVCELIELISIAVEYDAYTQ